MNELTIRCTCGELHGRLVGATPQNGNRLVCMCDDCQMYAHYLGRPSNILDDNGGTEVYQTTPSQLRFDAGTDRIAVVRLSGPKGLNRWFAHCCNTPIANTMGSPRAPFAGLHSMMLRHHPPSDLDDVLGPILARVQGRFGFGEQPADAHEKAPFWLIARAVRVLGGAWLAGKSKPNPFFDDTGEPIGQPRSLRAEDHAYVEAQARSWAADHG